MNLTKEKETAIKAAKEAGKILMENFKKAMTIKDKGDSLVSDIDLKSERKIIAIIKENFPEHSILSEEEGTEEKKSDYKWLIDPIDGTHNYIRGIPLFGISIALEYKKEIVLGVMYFPYNDELFIAEKGKGAYLNSKKIEVSKKNELKKALMIFDGALHLRKKEKIEFLNKVIDSIFRARIFGVATVDLSFVATGKADFLVAFSTNPWDIAAGFLILEEAGGKITDFEGNKWSQYMHEFIASNGLLHEQILKTIKR